MIFLMFNASSFAMHFKYISTQFIVSKKTVLRVEHFDNIVLRSDYI